MKKILISDPVDQQCAKVLKEAGIDYDFKTGLSPDELARIIKDYSGLIVRSETKVTPELIDLMENMEVIGRAGTGVDNIDLEAATRRGIIVMNTPGGNTISTAEHTMALMLSMFRNIPQANQSLRERRWDRKKYKGTELFGKIIGIIGLGKVGREVAQRAKSFGVKILGYDPVLSKEIMDKMGIELSTIENIFKNCDLISVHVPLSEETKYLINSENLKKCKDGIKIINCARGGIVNEEDLLEALNSSKVSSAALDVYEIEPPDFSNKLLTHPNVVCTPHLGASTEEAQIKVAVQIAEQIVELFSGKTPTGIVNASAIATGSNKEIGEYVKLAEILGSLNAQMISGQLKEVNFNYSGEILHDSMNLLSTAVMKGFLSKMLTENINFINAPYFSKELGIALKETKSESDSDYKNSLSVEFVTDKEKKLIAGTVLGNSEIRIIRVDDFHLEVKPEGNMVFYTNVDKPGVLAAVGKIFADAEINIAGLSLGRLGIGKKALTVVSVDSHVDKKILNNISLIPGVENSFAVVI